MTTVFLRLLWPKSWCHLSLLWMICHLHQFPCFKNRPAADDLLLPRHPVHPWLTCPPASRAQLPTLSFLHAGEWPGGAESSEGLWHPEQPPPISPLTLLTLQPASHGARGLHSSTRAAGWHLAARGAACVSSSEEAGQWGRDGQTKARRPCAEETARIRDSDVQAPVPFPVCL